MVGHDLGLARLILVCAKKYYVLKFGSGFCSGPCSEAGRGFREAGMIVFLPKQVKNANFRGFLLNSLFRPIRVLAYFNYFFMIFYDI